MPSNLNLSSSSMESEFHNRSDFEKSGSFDSQASPHSRSRSFNMDDENLKYLTNEEKNALMFLEETLDAFEDDIEEPPVSLNSSFGYYSPRSTEDSHSDSDDIIDLVQTGQNQQGVLLDTGSGPSTMDQKHTHDSRLLDVACSASTTTTPASIQRVEDHFPSEPPVDYPKFLGAVPTPVIVAQNISENKAENVHLSSMLPKDEKSPELKKSVATSPIGDCHFVFPSSTNGKPNRFPNNISVKLAGKQYNKTIAKAAVNVQERKAQVLANLHGQTLFAEEIDGKNNEQTIWRTSFRDVAPEQTRYEALTKLGLVKEMPVQANIQTSACTSPVSNGQHSPKFFPPEIQRRLSNEKVNTNAQYSSKILTSESNTKISNEHDFGNGQNASKCFITETKRIPSKEQDNMSGQHSPKVLTEESSRRLSNEQVNSINVQHSAKVLSPELSKRILNEHHIINGQDSSKFFTTETKRIPSKEQDNREQLLPKFLTEESSRRLSNEQESISQILRNEPSPFVPLGKTVIIKGDTATTPLDTSKHPTSEHINHEQKQPNTHQEVKRTYSVPRPTGFRSQGITVQFSGRDSSEESRKDALRKLGLLKEQSGL